MSKIKIIPVYNDNSNNKTLSWLVVLITFLKCISDVSPSQDNAAMYRGIKSFRDCLAQKDNMLVCFKEKAVAVLNETIAADKPISFYGSMIDIGRNPRYNVSVAEDRLPNEVGARSATLNRILYSKIEELFKSRVIKFNLAPAFDEENDDTEEGRGKKGGKGKGGMMMMGMIGMACMVGQLMMGKIAFLAGTALIIAKVALFLSAIIGLKKLAGGGGGSGETQHVVYAGGSDYGHSHGGGGGGGGGWHRSLDNDVHNVVYRGHSAEVDAVNGY